SQNLHLKRQVPDEQFPRKLDPQRRQVVPLDQL
ncbi:hypothetical protein NT06LI_0928, partial [Listeria innocua FSL J1-023]